MSTYAINPVSSTGFTRSTNPSGARLTRRGRLARTIVVLSLAVVMASGVAAKAGAGSTTSGVGASSYVVVTVAPGDTLWSIANAMADGRDVRSVVDEIVEVNGLQNGALAAGQKIRVGVK